MKFRPLVVLLAALTAISAGCQIGSSHEKYGPVTYAAVGASDTVGVGAEDPTKDSWVTVLNRRLPEGGTFVQLGVSGSTAELALAEQVPKAVAANPDLVTVWLAVNDANAFIPAETFGNTLEQILTRLRANDARVFVGNLPDLSKVPVYSQVPKFLIDQRVSSYNKEIQTRASKTGSVMVDLFAVYDQSSKDNGSLISSDGFHPSTEGYGVIADAFWTAIKADSVMGPRVSRGGR